MVHSWRKQLCLFHHNQCSKFDPATYKRFLIFVVMQYMAQHSIFFEISVTRESTHIKSYVMLCKKSFDMFENIEWFESIFLPIFQTSLKHKQFVCLNMGDCFRCSLRFRLTNQQSGL